ncbi:reverse transcriptase domain-containing protein [Tanacetum coccineum]
MAPVQGDLTATTKSISAALFTKREEEHVPIYFISRVLQGAELNYPRMETLILALVHAARRLRRFIVVGKSNKRYLRSQATNDQRILTEDQRGFEGLRQLHNRAHLKEPK